MNSLASQCRNLARITYLELLWSFRIPESLVYNFLTPSLVLLLLGFIRGSRDYMPILVSGLVALTIASSTMQGIGTKVSMMRAHGSWRTLQASPIPTGLYLVGLLCSRMVRVILIVGFMLGISSLFLGYRMQGSFALMFLYVVLGTSVFAALGLAVASLVSSPQAISGTLSMILLPMIFISDVLFITRLEWVKTVSLFFPLTFLVRLIRDNLWGNGLGDHGLTNLGALAAWLVLSSWAAVALAKRRVEEK
jgi:ABC-2 type transport system permease protein